MKFEKIGKIIIRFSTELGQLTEKEQDDRRNLFLSILNNVYSTPYGKSLIDHVMQRLHDVPNNGEPLVIVLANNREMERFCKSRCVGIAVLPESDVEKERWVVFRMDWAIPNDDIGLHFMKEIMIHTVLEELTHFSRWLSNLSERFKNGLVFPSPISRKGLSGVSPFASDDINIDSRYERLKKIIHWYDEKLLSLPTDPEKISPKLRKLMKNYKPTIYLGTQGQKVLPGIAFRSINTQVIFRLVSNWNKTYLELANLPGKFSGFTYIFGNEEFFSYSLTLFYQQMKSLQKNLELKNLDWYRIKLMDMKMDWLMNIMQLFGYDESIYLGG